MTIRPCSDGAVIVRVIAVVATLLAAPAALGADAWPMEGHDPARTSRSTLTSAQAPVLVPGWPIMSRHDGPLIAPGGRVELTLAGARTATLNRDGTFRRVVAGGGAIGVGGRRYAIDLKGRVSAFTTVGRRVWRSAPVDLGFPVVARPAPPSAGAAVHAIGTSGVVALGPAGGVRWRLDGFRGDTPRGFAVGPNGTAFIGFGSFVEANRLVAVRPDGSTAWTRILMGAPRGVAVSGDGTVLVGERAAGVRGETALRAFTSDGIERWTVPGAGNPAAIAADGTVYAASGGVLRAVAPDGSIRWIFRGTGVETGGVVVGGDGTLYVGGTAPQGMVALRADGSLAWAFSPGGAVFPTAIGADGTLYAGCATPVCIGNRGPTGTLFALAGPSGPRLLYGLRLSAARFRASGPPSVCAPGGGCRPAAPLGSTLSFVSSRPGIVAIAIRRARDGRVVGRTFGDSTGATVRVVSGRRYYSVLDVVRRRPGLAQGRYTVTVTAGAVRPVPLPFTVVR